MKQSDALFAEMLGNVAVKPVRAFASVDHYAGASAAGKQSVQRIHYFIVTQFAD